MDQTPVSPEPLPPPAPETQSPAAGGRRIKRRLMYAVAVLYAASLVAACVLILRSPAPGAAGNGRGQAQSLLSLAKDRDSVGWVSIHGAIMNSQGGRPWEKGAEQWVRRIKAMSETKGVKAIVLDINSPGGSVGAVQEIHSQILRIRKEKKIPFVALFGDISASGGYYIGSACDKIVAHPGTLTGSIGVIFSVSNLEGLFGKVGYKMEAIKSGKFKDIGSPARTMTPEERKLLQAMIDDAYGQFLAAVAQGRQAPVEKIKPLAEGLIYTGQQAVNTDPKLVDVLGDSDDATALAGKLGGITGKPRVRRDVERFSDILDMLDSRFHGILEGRSSLLDTLKPSEQLGLEYRWTGW
ncbi:MAG: signal peptide peptidase SppA [Elusimicrobia bacterium]|nr:signal peptide peptidase SppA [Elusimicrobiota bacterium]